MRIYDPSPSELLSGVALKREVRGVELDAQTRCAHYHSPLDVIAIRMKCCGVFYACKDCHIALADHPIQVWPREEWESVGGALRCVRA